MQISRRVYLLASGHLGCSFSHPNDCNVYAVRCGFCYFLIDTGVGLDTGRILSELESDKIQAVQVAGILLTHGHLDHSGGACRLHEALAVPVFSSRRTADALGRADEQAISLAAAKSARIYRPEVRLSACPVERVFEDRGISTRETAASRPFMRQGIRTTC
jgi:glyoxylase-like metal-dependent hydrolase (beta-lactamase superfamily II)